MIKKIREWWQGEYSEVTLEHVLGETEEGDAHFKRPWLAKALIFIGICFKKEWKWIIGFCLSAAALYIAYLKL